MRNYIIFLLLLIFYHSTSHAQLRETDRKFTDSLTRLITGNASDSLKAEAAFRLTDFWAETDSSKAICSLNKGRSFAARFPLLVARSYWYESQIYQENNFRKAQMLLMKAEALLKKFHTKKIYRLRSMVWHNYGLILQHQDNLKGMLEVLIHQVLPLSKVAGDNELLGTEYISIGTVFMNLEQYAKATPYLSQGIRLLKSAPPKQRYLLINAYLVIADNYCQLKEYELTKRYLNLSKNTLEESENKQFGALLDNFWLDYYKTSTRFCINTKQYNTALQHTKEASALAENSGDHYSIQEMSFERYKIFFAQKKYTMAKSALNAVINKPEFNALAGNQLALAEAVAEFNFATRNFEEAYGWLQKSKHLNDSLSESKLKQDVNALEIKYKNAENQKKIATLNADKKQNALIIRKTKTTAFLSIAASVLLLVILILLLIYYRNYRKLAEQRAINYQQKMADLAQKQQLEIGRAMLNAEEKERNRVARDLHDGLGGMLSGLKINLSNWAKQQEATLPDIELQRIVNQLDGSVTELRHIARNMMPQTLLKFGLETALKDLSESAMSHDMHVDFQAINISGNIALEEQIIIYRIVQEMLNNTLKHARASEVVLQCSENEKRFYVTLEDNGNGFDTSNYTKGMGLENIKNRVAYLKGNFDIESQPGNGTTINIEIPLRYE
ncbi:sensor histidine kinase [Pedobacter frigidisoli]|uniref:sensor histidine kinase n=1 Tax=Pedobacter frigidisoli TaxID=2530455 RepID=UPI00292DF258|nr:sensor histidine kinase [Pedobacter frigidisoli]